MVLPATIRLRHFVLILGSCRVYDLYGCDGLRVQVDDCTWLSLLLACRVSRSRRKGFCAEIWIPCLRCGILTLDPLLASIIVDLLWLIWHKKLFCLHSREVISEPSRIVFYQSAGPRTGAAEFLNSVAGEVFIDNSFEGVRFFLQYFLCAQ